MLEFVGRASFVVTGRFIRGKCVALFPCSPQVCIIRLRGLKGEVATLEVPTLFTIGRLPQRFAMDGYLPVDVNEPLLLCCKVSFLGVSFAIFIAPLLWLLGSECSNSHGRFFVALNP